MLTIYYDNYSCRFYLDDGEGKYSELVTKETNWAPFEVRDRELMKKSGEIVKVGEIDQLK